jgi:HAD superfamily phosphatase (TIGR01681 family)
MIPIPENCKLVIFDLDNTLHFESKPDQRLDMTIREIILYLKLNKVKIALASLNKSAENYLSRYNLTDHFDYVMRRKRFWECKTFEEYRLSQTREKTYMFDKILKELNIKTSEAILFDDRMRHIYEALKMDMKFCRVKPLRLLGWKDIKDGFEKFSVKRRYSIY